MMRLIRRWRYRQALRKLIALGYVHVIDGIPHLTLKGWAMMHELGLDYLNRLTDPPRP